RDHRQRDRALRAHAHDRGRLRRDDEEARERLRRDGSRQRLAARRLARQRREPRRDRLHLRGGRRQDQPRRRLAHRARGGQGRALGAGRDRRRGARAEEEGGAGAEGVRHLAGAGVMHFAFTEEQEELRAQAGAFLAEHASSEAVRRAMASEAGFEPELWKRIAGELGWTGVAIPEAFGGAGLGMVELVALLEPMGEAVLAAPFFASVCLAAPALLAAPESAPAREWLPAIAEGRATATLAAGAAGGRAPAGDDAIAWRRDGADYVLAGRDGFVLDGAT